MRILAFNASPRMENGATDKVLDRFLEGARVAGAEVEKVYLKKKRIVNCIGCYDCWFKTPGECVFKDDMAEIIQKLNQSEIAVFATPIYADTMISSMKAMIERLLPTLDPHFEGIGSRTRHKLREHAKSPKIVVISVCAFPEREIFEPLSLTLKKIAIDYHTEVIGEIYRPASEMLRGAAPSRVNKGFLEATFKAGQEIVKTGRISQETQKQLDKSAMNSMLFRMLANRQWSSRRPIET